MSQHRNPKIVLADGAAEVECDCGWRSPRYREIQSASYAWALHVAHQAKRRCAADAQARLREKKRAG